jgi:DUF1009 family protein
MSTSVKKLGILSGEGSLPLSLIIHCLHKNIPVCAVQFKGCDYNDWPDIPVLKTRIEKVGDIFAFLKHQQVSDVVMIGNLQRPSLKSLRPDLKGLKTLGKIAKSFAMGDDNLLRSLRTEIEKEGFAVKGIDYFLTNLTAEAGTLTKRPCDSYGNEFIDIAIKEAIKHGKNDKGQSILAHRDGTFSYEGPNGTTALIKQEGREGSILVKMMKPQQDPDLDRPTVGLHTLEMLHTKYCSGMIIQAKAVFMIDRQKMIDYANAHDLFIEGVNA